MSDLTVGFRAGLSFPLGAREVLPTRRSGPPTALISALRLVEFGGSEITCLEVSEVLRDFGYSVTIVSEEFGRPWLDNLPSDVRHMLIGDLPFDTEVDLAWMHHAYTAYMLFGDRRLRPKHALFSSLSHFEPLEGPPVRGLRFSHYTVNSSENRENFVGLYRGLARNTSVLPNSAPDRFFAKVVDSAAPRLTSVAVVSNHVPAEVDALMRLFGEQAIAVQRIGLGGTVQRVTPELLGGVDAVITIGKTVQYCLAAGVPVFCYDRFGGPGWIVPSNVERAAAANFSGRCTAIKQGPSTLADMVLSGFAFAHSQRGSLREIAGREFHLATNLDLVLKRTLRRRFVDALDAADRNSLVRLAVAYRRARSVIGELEKNVHDLATTVERQQKLLDAGKQSGT